MVICYLRVSRVDQDTEKFKHGVLEYANGKGFAGVEFIEEKVSGARKWQDRKLGQIVNELKKGDVLLIPELSRLARSISQIYEIFEAVKGVGAEIHVIKQGIVFRKKMDMQSKMMLWMLSMMAELERDYISIRTKEALAEKKRQGVRLGRPEGERKLEEKREEIEKYVKMGLDNTSIGKLLGAHRHTVARFVRENKLRKLTR